MCDVIQTAYALSRRSLLKGGATLAAGAFASSEIGKRGASAATAPAIVPPADAKGYRTRLVLLGTSGGPVWYPGSTRQMISSAVVVGDAVYLVDCGEGWTQQYRRASFGAWGAGHALDNLRALFLTHLHSDHTVDYPNLLLLGLYNGLANVQKPIEIYGPGRRGQMEPIFGHPKTAPPVVNPDNATPGIVDLTNYLIQAYATDVNDRMRDVLRPDPRSLIRVSDIPLPAGTGSDPNGRPSPPMDPFTVYRDENVRVSATLVYHAPIFPAFAFRFDTAEGAIVFSGDTGSLGAPNLIKLANRADILVHEVIDRRWVDGLFLEPHTPTAASIVNHLLSAHTELGDVGKVAQDAGVGTLVLTHLVPADNPDDRWMAAQHGYSGRLIVGQDLLELGVGKRSA